MATGERLLSEKVLAVNGELDPFIVEVRLMFGDNCGGVESTLNSTSSVFLGMRRRRGTDDDDDNDDAAAKIGGRAAFDADPFSAT